MERTGIPIKPPAAIIGAAKVRALHAEGYRIVPTMATAAMKRAAAETLSHWKSGEPWVSTTEKAGLRWDAMLRAWTRDGLGMVQGERMDQMPQTEKKPRWTWRIGKYFELAVDWIVERDLDNNHKRP